LAAGSAKRKPSPVPPSDQIRYGHNCWQTQRGCSAWDAINILKQAGIKQ
jgi:hypothetical protein